MFLKSSWIVLEMFWKKNIPNEWQPCKWARILTFFVCAGTTVLYEALLNFLNWVTLSPSGSYERILYSPKVQFFIYRSILMKFETQPFHMFTKNNWDRNLWILARLTLWGLFSPPPSQKIKFFIYCMILMKFEI